MLSFWDVRSVLLYEVHAIRKSLMVQTTVLLLFIKFMKSLLCFHYTNHIYNKTNVALHQFFIEILFDYFCSVKIVIKAPSLLRKISILPWNNIGWYLCIFMMIGKSLNSNKFVMQCLQLWNVHNFHIYARLCSLYNYCYLYEF